MSSHAVTGRPAELGKPGYELFIAGLTIISLINWVLVLLPGVNSNAKFIAEGVDVPITLVFLIGFTNRLRKSHPRRAYFIGQHGRHTDASAL